MSDKQFLAEKAGSLPLYKCYVTKGWKESGEAIVTVARRRGNGNLCVANFEVDTWCCGVKDVFGDTNMSQERFEDILTRFPDGEEIDYPLAHNLIYGSVEFAGEAGIEPPREYWKWQGILDEDTDDVPYIDIEFGRDGKYYLMADSGSREALMVPQLKKKLGNQFDYTISYDDSPEFPGAGHHYSPDELRIMQENMEKTRKEDARHPDEPFSYDYPAYPSGLKVKHQLIADTLRNPAFMERIPDDKIKEILEIPSDEIVDDLRNIVLYEIGKTYKGEVEEEFNGSIMHAMLILSQLRNPKGMDIVMEVLRQNDEFNEYHFGGIGAEVLSDTIYACSEGRIEPLEQFLKEPGHDMYMRSYVLDAIQYMSQDGDDKRKEVVDFFSRYLDFLGENLPSRHACSGTLAAFVVANIMDLNDKSLLPKVKRLYDRGLVNTNICGDYDNVEVDMDINYEPKGFSFKSVTDFYDRFSD